MASNQLKLLLPFFTYGAYQILRQALSISYSLYRNFIRQPFNFPKRYGTNSWALVTGAGAGIGKAFSEQLAQRGMNVIMLGRGQNVKDSADELSAKYPNVQFHTVIFDLSQIQFESEELLQQLGDRDISILVNNAGLGNSHSFHLLPVNLIYDMINVNASSVIYLTHLLIGKMAKREKRGAIINISSVSGQVPIGYLSTYSSAKHLVGYFTNAIAYEYQDKLDVLAVYPNKVSTKLLSFAKVEGWTVSPDDCAAGSLRQLGAVYETSGAWRHNLKQWIDEVRYSKAQNTSYTTSRMANYIAFREGQGN